MTPTVCIKWPSGEGFAYINQVDFNPEIHQLYVEGEMEAKTEILSVSEQVETETEPKPTTTRKTRKTAE